MRSGFGARTGLFQKSGVKMGMGLCRVLDANSVVERCDQIADYQEWGLGLSST
jgi:hypothetical protein